MAISLPQPPSPRSRTGAGTRAHPHPRAGHPPHGLRAQSPGAADLPAAPGHHPRLPSPVALGSRLRRDLGQPLDPALRRHGLLARPAPDGRAGICGDRQVGGSISFVPGGDGADAKWLSDDTRHLLAELDPKPDQVTIAINTNQMNIMELMTADDIRGTSFERPDLARTYAEMTVPAGPEWVAEHLLRLRANDIQPHLQLANIAQLETVERLVRRGIYLGPLNITWVAIGGGFDGPSPYNMMEFIRRVPDGATLTLDSIQRNVLPVNAMAVAMGLHTRCGNEDTLWGQKDVRATSVEQIEQIVRLAMEMGRGIADAKDTRDQYRIGTWYDDVDDTLARLGFPPNRKPDQLGFLMHA